MLSKKNSELHEKYDKLCISSQAEINIEKEQHKKTLVELASLSKDFKNILQENNDLKSILQMRTAQIEDLNNQLEMKTVLEQKLQERDINKLHKNVSHPDLMKEQDVKMLALMKTYEKQKEKIENENRLLKKEISTLRSSHTESSQRSNIHHNYSKSLSATNASKIRIETEQPLG